MKRIVRILMKLLVLPAQISALMVGIAGILFWNDHDASPMVLFAGVGLVMIAVRRIGNNWLWF